VDAYSADLLTGSQSVTDFRRRGAKKRGSPSFFRLTMRDEASEWGKVAERAYI